MDLLHWLGEVGRGSANRNNDSLQAGMILIFETFGHNLLTLAECLRPEGRSTGNAV